MNRKSDPEKSVIGRQFGRQAFGGDPSNYHTARPAYPEWVFELLCQRCGLAAQTATFEIGAGTGIATRRLLELGASPLMAIEPDKRMATFLARNPPDPALRVITSSFEEADLAEESFDLGVSATAFHWLSEEEALKKVARLLRPGGWWAMCWQVFGDPSRADPFHEATRLLLQGPGSPAEGIGPLPFALDTKARLAALQRVEAFQAVEYFSNSWSLELNVEQTVNLYATYSNITIRLDRESVLAELARIARQDFGGKVIRNMVTSLYIAQRCFEPLHSNKSVFKG
jgi:SAM-dependent methyltransferase